MHFVEFEKLVEEAFTHPHYKYRSREECKEPAKKSFDRLTADQKAHVVTTWLTFLEQEKVIESAGKITPDTLAFEKLLVDLQLYRFICQTNLFFLCHVLEKYSQTTVETHEEICNDHFIQKDPTYPSFDHFADAYTGLKESLLLVPRGGFKSSIDIADSVQWAICFPEVTIAIITGVTPLAIGFVGELREHFTLDETGLVDENKKPIYVPRKLLNKVTREFSTSVFQCLFPEHCTKPGDGKSSEWESSAILGSGDKEPTVKAAGLDQALSGWHHMILKLDDCVNDENSNNLKRIEQVNKDISVMEALMNPNGFKDVIGTWYDEQDYYGQKIRHEETTAKEEGLDTVVGSVDSGRFNSHSYIKVYLRACWWPTEEAQQLGKIEEEMKKSDYVLWFPERLTFDYLKRKSKLDPYFAIKYLNNPRKHHQVKFPKELLLRRTIPYNQVPTQGLIVSAVDTAYSIKNWADFTVMITALISGGRFYILNMVRGRYNEYELPQVLAATANKWKTKRIAIEDSVGVKWMGRELRREMDKLRISIPVEFISLGLGSQKNSKKMKAKPVVRLLGDERLYFVNSCENINEIYNELEKFTGTPDDEHDDIVSALSLLVEQFEPYANMDVKVNYATTDYVSNRKSDEMYRMIYGLGKYAKYNRTDFQEDNPSTLYQMEKSAPMLESTFSGDPLNDLF